MGLRLFKRNRENTDFEQGDSNKIIEDIMNSNEYQDKKYEDLYSRYTKTRKFRNASKNIGIEDSSNQNFLMKINPYFNNWLNSKRGNRISNKYDKMSQKQYRNNINDIFNSINYTDKYFKFYGIDKNKPNINFYHDVSTGGEYNKQNNTIKYGMNLPKEFGGAFGIGAHELGHYYDKNFGKTNNLYPKQYIDIFSRYKPDSLYPNSFEDHDKNFSENYADFIANRALMNKHGIYNSISGKPIKMRQIKRYRRKYGKNDRLFRMYDNNTIKQMYDNII